MQHSLFQRDVFSFESIDEEEVGGSNQRLKDWFTPIVDVGNVIDLIANALENRKCDLNHKVVCVNVVGFPVRNEHFVQFIVNFNHYFHFFIVNSEDLQRFQFA
jgi:hypothetical protein